MSAVPLVDLKAQHDEVADEVRSGFEEVIATTSFVDGKAVLGFEEEFVRFLGAPLHCVGVANGTDALELALRVCGVGPGTEVVLPANTFIATAEAVARAGATPVVVDVDPRTLLMAEDQAVAAFTGRTRAVVPVHLYGQTAPVEALARAAREHGVAVVEDAAQAQGARRYGEPAGGLGDIAGTSFYPGKNLGAYGDAGAVVTRSESLADQVRLIANHGSRVRYRHDVIGFNSRLDTLQAVVLRAKLKRLGRWNQLRQAAAARYHELLADLDGVRRPEVAPGNEHVWHLYVIEVDDRDEVLERLRAQGIGAAVHYPVPIHRHPAFEHLGRPAGGLPIAERSAGRILSLPLFPHITSAQQEQVIAALKQAR